jgi:uncharacterized protein YcbK (DUF882 family)
MLAVATSLSGCVASALDIQSTFAPTPSVDLGLAPADTSSAPPPASEIAAAETGQSLIAEGDALAEDGAAMALAGDEPTATSADDVPVQQAMLDQSGEITPVTGAVQAETAELVELGDPQDKTVRPADPATARIYSATAAPTVTTPQPVVTAGSKRNTGLLSLFSNNRSNSARKALIPPQPVKQQPAVAELWSATDNAAKAATAEQPPARPVIAVASASAAQLPGVDRERALGLNQPSPDSESGPEGVDERPVQLASAAGLARLAPNGLRVQHDDVDVACLKPALVRVLKQVERHYGQNVVVTSGYRSPSRNKKARGAEHSLHMYCSAADIQIEGVSKWELASYLRSMPGRGGVGTYCYTESVHIDIGPERDWNWRCRRRK